MRKILGFTVLRFGTRLFFVNGKGPIRYFDYKRLKYRKYNGITERLKRRLK